MSSHLANSDLLQVDGQLRATRNSEGRLIHPTPEGIRNFWRWFGNSQAVDALGRPRVFYHGTTVWERGGRQLGDIAVFNRHASTQIVKRASSVDQVGIWFSDRADEQGAGLYAQGGAIYPVYLKATDYKRITFAQMSRMAAHLTGVEEFRSYMKEQGYDSLMLIHDDKATNGSTEFLHQNVLVMFEPNQIKSAVGNTGEFALTNDAITDVLTSPKKRHVREQELQP